MPIRLGGLALLAILAGGASLLVGGTPLAPSDVIGALFHPNHASDVTTIVWQLRLPRVLIAMLVGSSLSLGGVLLQGMLRNPLVDPYLTGVSAGAGAAIAISILVGVAAPL